MNAFQIKVIAILTMIVDHIGLFFFPESFLFRMIGRISFPLFAWLIANGVYHTRNIKKYLYRLLIFAVISQVPYLMTYQQIYPQEFPLNIFFTLSLGVFAIALIKCTKQKIHMLLITLLVALVATLISADYGGLGVVSIVAFYTTFHDKKKMLMVQVWIYILMSISFLVEGNTLGLIQWIGLLALIPISLYSGKEGPKLQYLFYVIYPLHLMLIYLVLYLR